MLPITTHDPITGRHGRILDLDLDPDRDPHRSPDAPGFPAAPLPPLQRENLGAILNLAAQLHRDGNLERAEEVYRQVLTAAPDHAHALRLLGLLHFQRGAHGPALALLQRSVVLDPSHASAFRHLGEAYRAVQRFDDAVHAFEQALRLEPEDSDSLCNLGHAFLQRGSFRAAERCYREALVTRPEDAEVCTWLGVSQMQQHRREDAADSYRRALASDPDHVEARHMLSAISGERVDGAPARYVADLFDRYATTFDEHLVSSLQYRVPELMREAVNEVEAPAGAAWRIADLGCGTGLGGAAFRDVAGFMVGVDLSPGMIEQAARRGLYDRLVTGELESILNPEHGPYDLVIAADVLVYLGDLGSLFERSRAALAPAGLLAFSTERGGPEPWVLRSSGRFAHGEPYIRDLADRFGFDVALTRKIDTRLDQGRPIPGQMFVLRREG